MAARATSAFCHFALILNIFLLINYNKAQRFGDRANNLHITEGDDTGQYKKPLIIESIRPNDEYDFETSFIRDRRDVSANNPNITTKLNALNDSHQQLMVHWVGEGSNVIICLARDSTPLVRLPASTNPSAVYISYDYGDTFENKTEKFKTSDSNDQSVGYAALDKFYNHPKFNTHCVFADSSNKLIFTTWNNGKDIIRQNLPFHPSDISFHEDDPLTFLALDKIDPERKLWLTRDMGKTWVVIQEYVKAFFWTSTQPKALLVERQEPSGVNTVLSSTGLFQTENNFTVVIANIEDFQIRGDYMFATKKSGNNDLDLYVSYKQRSFVEAQFNTELSRRDYHIADVSSNRVLVAVSHNEFTANLYVSEIIANEQISFTLSLERVVTFFPNSTWKDTWLNDVSDEAFTDLYKVEGLRGIYIVSQVKELPKDRAIGPEHLVSLITYDHGTTWSPIKAPQVDNDGFFIPCHEDPCSLHLSQKFSQLYPATRSVSIMSSKSAPGIIIATGVIGKRLKGHPGVFVSRDAGLTWKQVLKDYYFFNMGDHGGVLVAVKYFKSRGETRDILYSTNEGETWHTHEFNDDMLRVYGLMTEPGENTTVFTMFGSGNGQHQWLIVKVDVRKVFERDCNENDFKFWSPSSTDQPTMACVLGRKETYQRRSMRANCYTGINYDRPIRSDICLCDAKDYRCEVGFHSSMYPYHCIRNKSTPTGSDPYALPPTCKPGLFYNRTKGYRKIEDDDCSGGLARNFEPDEIPCPMKEISEFLLVAQRDHISRIDLKELRLEALPVHGLKNVIAIEFDLKHDCLYWADIVNDTIGRQCLKDGTSYPEILVETDLSSIEGMAFDWVSKVLYFVDGVKMRIEIIRVDISTMGRMRRTILGSDKLKKPRGIAVHPMNGYMFWTDWAPGDASVSRANLDGSNVKRLFNKDTVEWPNGITIDHIAERIYWVDAKLDYIGSSDLDGQKFKKILAHDERLAHPFAVAVFKDNMYWDDWKQSMIFVADKDHGLGLTTIMGQLVGLMDLKVFANSVQVGTNKCSNSTICSHICLGAPNNEFVCLCPDGMEMDSTGKCVCPGGTPAYSNSTCPRVASTCSPNQFACSNGVCVPELWKCDGDNDCGDNSDELHCNRVSCEPNHFACDDGKCIPQHWVCDFDNDCKDNTDELKCHYPTCTDAQFKCDSGQCIARRWHCDGESDCRDASDEKNCSRILPNTCETGQFLCNKSNYQTCIPMAWRCDGESDCENGTDEAFCETQNCENWQFTCKSTKRCIYGSWVCDGDNDCPDGSDEFNCTYTTPSPFLPPLFPNNSCSDWMFRCNNKKCVPYWWKCDSVDDCGDNSDEVGCGNIDGPTAPPQSTEQPRICREHQFQCYDGKCIDDSWVCDGSPDCNSGEDEIHCDGVTIGCRSDQFRCRSDGLCIALTNICNNISECPDGSDELGCHNQPQSSPAPIAPCPSGQFHCDQTRCLPKTAFCDGHQDCYDDFDEKDCEQNNNGRVYQVLTMHVDETATNASSLTLFWWLPVPNNITFEYLPSIGKAESTSKWINATDWVGDMKYQFNNLDAYTNYNWTVYVRIQGQDTVFPPAIYSTAFTGEGAPSPPWNVAATQKNGTRIEVSWRPPLHPNGPITGYEVYVTPPIPPQLYTLQKTSLIVATAFEAGKNYSFWVIARNRDHQSNSSNIATILFDGAANIDDIEHLSVTATTNSTVTLTWDKMINVSGYHVTPKPPKPYPSMHTITVSTNSIVIDKLSPGTKYTFEVNAFKKNYIGKGVLIGATTTGSPLPSVHNLQASLMKDQGTTVKLSWDPPKDSRKIKWQYGIYFALNMQDLFRESRTTTTNLTAAIKDLQACEKYMFAVGVLGHFGAGPLSPPLTVSTHYNSRAAPKNLRVAPSDTKYEIIVSWTSSCPRMEEPIAYTITITELIANIPKVITTLPTNETTMKQRFQGIKFGGKYHITIATDVTDAIPSQPVIYLAPPILPPHQISVLPEDSSYIIYWQEHDLSEIIPNGTEYHYEVFVAEDEREINETTAQKFQAKDPPLIFKNAKPYIIYSFAVRLVVDNKYRSWLSETVSTESSGTAKPLTIYTSNVLSFAIPICLLVIALGAALGYFVVRHRRLSNSFTQFANSHYDTRRGQATFPGTTDGLDDEDSPVIRGFSDDEPLVIA